MIFYYIYSRLSILRILSQFVMSQSGVISPSRCSESVAVVRPICDCVILFWLPARESISPLSNYKHWQKRSSHEHVKLRRKFDKDKFYEFFTRSIWINHIIKMNFVTYYFIICIFYWFVLYKFYYTINDIFIKNIWIL